MVPSLCLSINQQSNVMQENESNRTETCVKQFLDAEHIVIMKMLWLRNPLQSANYERDWMKSGSR